MAELYHPAPWFLQESKEEVVVAPVWVSKGCSPWETSGQKLPGREAGANWKGHESIITSTKDNLSSLERFVITLDRSRINRVREYNDVHSYDTFNLSEMEKSPFIEANPNIIDRK